MRQRGNGKHRNNKALHRNVNAPQNGWKQEGTPKPFSWRGGDFLNFFKFK